MPDNCGRRSRRTAAIKRWRHRKLVDFATATPSAAARTVAESTRHCRYGSHLSRNRRRASGVPVKALKLRRHATQR
jgi:hypothetical protein